MTVEELMNLGRSALVAGDDVDLGRSAVTQLLEDHDDPAHVLALAHEARAAFKPHNALVAIDELLSYHPDHEEGASLWFELALDDLGKLDDVVEMATAMAVEDRAWAERMIAEVLSRNPAHAGALAFR